jgi:hypothetical protein
MKEIKERIIAGSNQDEIKNRVLDWVLDNIDMEDIIDTIIDDIEEDVINMAIDAVNIDVKHKISQQLNIPERAN